LKKKRSAVEVVETQRREHDETLLVVDISDIRKKHAKKMEHLARVRDGDVGKLVDGYGLLNVAACKESTSRTVPFVVARFRSIRTALCPFR